MSDPTQPNEPSVFGPDGDAGGPPTQPIDPVESGDPTAPLGDPTAPGGPPPEAGDDPTAPVHVEVPPQPAIVDEGAVGATAAWGAAGGPGGPDDPNGPPGEEEE